MRAVPGVLLVLLFGLSLAIACEAADNLTRDLERLERLREALDVDADRIDYAEADRKVVASGNVRIVMGNRFLFADEVSADLDDQILVATGHVILMEGFNRLEGDRIEYNYRTNLGVVSNGRGTLEPGIGFSGAEIRREGERQYSLKDGRFTACRACEPEPATPDWEFRASEATIYQDEWIASRNTSFWIKGIPAMFSPVLALPIGPRRTGFLIPRFSYGAHDGFGVKLPFFWAIDRSQDATIIPIYRTKRGFELDGEYRYVLDEHSRGAVTGRYYHDLQSGDQPPNRADGHWVHDQVLSPNWALKVNAQYQTDRTVNRAFIDNSAAERTQSTLDSIAFVSNSTPRYVFTGLAATSEDLSGLSTNWLMRVPEANFQWLPAPLFGSPLIGEGNTSAVFFTQTGETSTGRFDLYPALHLPLDLSRWLTSATSVALRETAYTSSGQGGGGANRFLVEAGQQFGSRFARRFDQPGLGFQRLTHVVEPSLGYLYVPWVNQLSLPQFGLADFVSGQNRLAYRLANRIMARRETGGEVRNYELASLSIAQSVNLQPQTREFSNLYLEALTPERIDQAVTDVRPLGNSFSQATERRWSNLVFRGSVNPLPSFGVYGTVALDVEHPNVEGVNSGVVVRFLDTLTLDLGQSYVRNQAVDGLVAKLLWRVTRALTLDWLTRYDIRTNTWWENTAHLRFSTCCWDVTLKFTSLAKAVGVPAQNSATVTFDLKSPTSTTAR
jgi:lipopolysaccharide assembly outer membrane protein LptD (OstA)